MEFTFLPMTREYAAEIKSKWHYSGEYMLYDYVNDDCIDDPKNWNNVFAVFDGQNSLQVTLPDPDTTKLTTENDPFPDLIGEFTIYLEDGELWVGCGMKPELTGHGLGEAFVRAGVAFGIKHFKYHEKFVKLGVLETNQRALKVYQRVGFTIYEDYTENIDGKRLQFFRLRYTNPEFTG